MFGFRGRLLLAVTFIFSTLPAGNGINCYRCDAVNDEDCEDPFNTTMFVPKTCINENFACVKQGKFYKEHNRTYLHRGCIQKHYCEILAKASDFCITCTTDLCNSSTVILPSFILTTVFIAKNYL